MVVVPKYGRIVDAVRADIEGGRIPVGSTLPSEEELARRFRVSRMTVRQAHGILERQGLIERRQGVGTVVLQDRIQRSIGSLTGLAEDLRASGHVPGAKVLRFDRVAVGHEAALALGVSEGSPVVAFYRLRTADGEPIGLQDHLLPAEIVPALEPGDLEDNSLYSLIEQRYGLRIGSAEQRMHVRMPTATEASLLQVSLTAPLWAVKRFTRLADGRPFELLDALYRADRVSYSTRLVRATDVGSATDERAAFLVHMPSPEGKVDNAGERGSEKDHANAIGLGPSR